MPYYRRPYRRRYYRRRYYRKRQLPEATWGQVARKALSTALSIKKYMLNPEKNIHDVTASAIPLATSWVITNLSNIAQGDDSVNRQGRSVKFLGINFRGGVSLQAASTSTYRVRIIIFVDTMQLGLSDPGATNVFVSDNIDAQRNQLGSPGRFRFLYDRSFTLTPNGKASSYVILKKPLNILTKYIGVTGADASNYRNAIYIGYVCDNVAGAAPLLSYTNRLWFIDN